MAVNSLPLYRDLPQDPSLSPRFAWGIWGPSDQLGCLNLLTPERRVAAAQEVREGVSIGLNWGMDQMRVPPWYRSKLRHEIVSIAPNCNDDKLEFNTQTSTQWDGFRHWAFPDGRFYNGFTMDGLHDKSNKTNGIHEWAKQGIVGRGVLIDYVRYAIQNNLEYDPWSARSISIDTIQEIAKSCNIVFQPGDILLLRTGFVEKYESLDHTTLQSKMSNSTMTYPGLEGSERSLGWLWDTHFAAVASDSPGFEFWNSGLGVGPGFRMHEIMLSGLGLPIGELFSLRELARQCEKSSRWSFMFVSEVLNVPGGVGSPPNALAIL